MNNPRRLGEFLRRLRDQLGGLKAAAQKPKLRVKGITVDSKTLEFAPERIYAGFPSFLGFGLWGSGAVVPTFWLLLYARGKSSLTQG